MADRALLMGINNYKAVSDLRGCVNDLENVRDLLVSECGFTPRAVRIRKDDQVTKEELFKQWDWLLQGAKSGDRLVFHFSGHGSYITDDGGDEDDGVDELLCLHDMDFSDPGTFLRDDELRELTERVPAGVSLTVVLDCCHSGTGTRTLAPPPGVRAAALSQPDKLPLVDVQTSLARLGKTGAAPGSVRSLSLASPQAADLVQSVVGPADPQNAPQTVLARFCPPPPEVFQRLEQAGVRGSFQRDAVEMSHVLLAGCQSNQTSADAHIGGDFHGAFTYHLCETVRTTGADIDHQDLIQTVRGALRDEHFSQIPQLEPTETRGPLFRRDTGESTVTTPGGRPNSTPKPKKSDETQETQENRPSAARDAVIVELLQEVLEQLRGMAAMRQRTGPQRQPGSQHGEHALVYVHGICEHHAGYSNDWFDALAQYLVSPLKEQLTKNRHEVLWSEHVRSVRAWPAGLPQGATEPDPRECEALAQSIRDVLQDRAERHALHALPSQASGGPPVEARAVVLRELGQRGALDRAMLGIPGLNCVDDFMKYLLSDTTRRQILEEFDRVVGPLLNRGAAVEVISHSWGTVVAYEALRRMDDETPAGRVQNWFTVGSALSIEPVKRRLLFRDGRRPRQVRRWINLDARGDVVGGSLRSRAFAVDEEYLNLEPVGCPSRPILGPAPDCAHGSYFRRENSAVNRDLFARLIAEP